MLLTGLLERQKNNQKIAISLEILYSRRLYICYGHLLVVKQFNR